MITVTKTVYKGEEKDNLDFVVEFVKTFQFLKVEDVLKLVETIGFEQDERNNNTRKENRYETTGRLHRGRKIHYEDL